MIKKCLIAGIMILCAQFNSNAQNTTRDKADTVKADATIPNATVYFGYGAELTHQSKVKVDATTNTIFISQLSTNIEINSLQISVPEDVALMSHKFQVFYPVAPVIVRSKEVEKLEDSVEILLLNFL